MLSHDKATKYLDVLLQVLHACDELVGDKLLPAELVIAGVKAALASLHDDKIADVTPDDIRDLVKRLREDVKAVDAAHDKKLHDKFDTKD